MSASGSVGLLLESVLASGALESRARCLLLLSDTNQNLVMRAWSGTLQ